jgi:hypothetical protein
MRKITQFDHHLEAIALLSRADVHLEFLMEDEAPRSKELTAALRSDIAAFIKKRFPS